MINAHEGNEVCSDTLVIRSNDDWKRVVQHLQYDGQRYHSTTLRVAGNRLNATEQDAGLFALVGSSS